MEWKDVGKTVASIAPVLGTVLGGPVGLIAGAAGSLIANVLGVESDPKAVQAAVAADPEAIVKLKQIEADHQSRLLDWQAQQIQADLENVKSARDREVKMVQAGAVIASWLPPALISTIVSLGFFVVLYKYLEAPNDMGDGAMLLLGTLAAAFSAVVNYYLGSSLGSAQKTNLMTKNTASTESMR